MNKMSNLPNVSPAVETSYPVSVMLAPIRSSVEKASQRSDGMTKPTVVTRFTVKGVGSEQALEAAKTRVRSMGYAVRSANHSNNGIVVYVSGGK